MSISMNLMEKNFFINIGRYKKDPSDTYFQWKSSLNVKIPFFTIQEARNAPEKRLFYCIIKDDIKLVYYVTYIILT